MQNLETNQMMYCRCATVKTSEPTLAIVADAVFESTDRNIQKGWVGRYGLGVDCVAVM
jgi:hypothetical protein